ncbi:MAG TPA: hypothetical protein DEP43_00680 [Ruminococcaceae bacterium]|nr:hypothetical protein [Oscillospiraceae bacterium]
MYFSFSSIRKHAARKKVKMESHCPHMAEFSATVGRKTTAP